MDVVKKKLRNGIVRWMGNLYPRHLPSQEIGPKSNALRNRKSFIMGANFLKNVDCKKALIWNHDIREYLNSAAVLVNKIKLLSSICHHSNQCLSK